MKKQHILTLALSVSLTSLPLIAPLALAEDSVPTSTSTNINATTSVDATTDSSSTDWLPQLIDKLQTKLGTDSTVTTNSQTDQTPGNTSESDTLTELGDTGETQVPTDEYSKKLKEAQDFLEELSAKDSDTMPKLELAVSNDHAQNIKVLGNLLDKLPSKASERLAFNIVRSMEKSVDRTEKTDQQSQEVTTTTNEAASTTNEVTPTTNEVTPTTNGAASVTNSIEDDSLNETEASSLTDEEQTALDSLNQTFGVNGTASGTADTAPLLNTSPKVHAEQKQGEHNERAGGGEKHQHSNRAGKGHKN
ncbi:hypothetical protein [Desulfosporosinus sp. FKA]|uniref:hypothetical protein n=1 Tax=Desulfosporosinus sp. FKA TaxID=1969834 RepID=UPI000B49A560|nr:hypothetical protein [Desulfosporosinus sp. FKA]